MNYEIRPSKIHGNGVFATRELYSGEQIEVGIDFYLFFFPRVTPYFGSLINHSWTPNTKLIYHFEDNQYWIHAKNTIKPNEELTLDYRETPWFIDGPSQNWT